MTWIQKGSKRYYYRSERCGARTRRRYVGCGDVAELAATTDELHRLQRAIASRERQAERERLLQAEAPLRELIEQTDLLVRAVLVAAGYHQHDRGEWRRPRVPKESNRSHE
ncbi:MAG: hypothetical protein ACYC6M_15740 [Terriglobales bacterium]